MAHQHVLEVLLKAAQMEGGRDIGGGMRMQNGLRLRQDRHETRPNFPSAREFALRLRRRYDLGSSAAARTGISVVFAPFIASMIESRRINDAPRDVQTQRACGANRIEICGASGSCRRDVAGDVRVP